jgi:hypothetical protein
MTKTIGIAASCLATAMLFSCGDDPANNADADGATSITTVPETTTGVATTTGGLPSTTDAVSTSSGPTSGMDTSSSGDPETPVVFDVVEATGGGDACHGGANDLTLTGTVWAPNGVIPVSGALVYTSENEPDGIPQEVFCAECAELQCDDRFTTTAADGSFTLNTLAADARYLVVQKGQFLKITPIDFNPGMEALDDELTSLPGRNEPENGLYIPLIAVGDGSYDRLEDALGKFGLGDTMISNFEERLVPDTESFDLWDNGRSPGSDGFDSQGTFAQLVANPEELARYHVIFAPCSTDTYVSALNNATNVANVRDWVAAGGRWYVSDWSNEWLVNIFPEYQDLDCTGGISGPCDQGSYDSMADVLDMELLEWLEALPDPLKDINPLNNESHPTLFDLPQVQTVDNWSSIVTLNPVLVDDGMGGMVDVGHKVWLDGPGGGYPSHPLTVTGQFGCGKIQFTSYHTAEFFNYVGLSPQELVLIYTILEIGVCQDPLPPPEG